MDIDELEYEMGNAACEQCGCYGNRECPNDETFIRVDYPDDCTLNELLICPCCESRNRGDRA